MWRPADWVKGGNPKIEGVQYHNYDEESFEAGADTMLEALKAEGRDCVSSVGKVPKHQNKLGWLAFIPEE